MMMRCLQVCLLSIFILICPRIALADDIPFLQEIPRKVLAFHKIELAKDEDKQEDIVDTSIHLYAEVILNHLGLELVYRSIEDPLPSVEEMKGFVGVLTWFSQINAIPDPNVYCPWGQRLIEKGLKMVILETPGYFSDASRTIPEPCQEMLHAMGAHYEGNHSDNPFYFEVSKKDSAMVEFERKLLLVERHEYSHYQVISPEAKVYLQLRRRDQEDSESDVIFTTPQGGFVHPSYANFVMKDLNKTHWRINPFLFFEEAFGLKGLPRPDTTTINGRRIFYSHIDGDGIVNKSHIDQKSYSGEVILKEVLKKYPALPITNSFITGYFDMREFQHDQVMEMYRSILELPNVEIASHGHAHPLVWEKGVVAVDVPGYEFSAKAEIAGSVKKIRNLLEKFKINKEVNLFLWTGDCRPTEDQISVSRTNRLLNMNGGDSRFDKRYDSYSFLYPLSIIREEERQIYSSAPNENIYTNEWEGPYYGFAEIVDTFQNTESPTRIKPINIYYHYYSGEVAAALLSVKKAYDYSMTQDIFPIFASQYVPIVKDFFSIKMSPLFGGGYQILNAGDLKTIRFDRETRNIDLTLSEGVLGFQHFQESLYVFLDDRRSHAIYLNTKTPTRPYVISASFHIKGFRGNRLSLRFKKKGWFNSTMILGGMHPDKEYWVYEGEERSKLKSDQEGRLKITFKQAENGGDFQPVSITAHY